MLYAKEDTEYISPEVTSTENYSGFRVLAFEPGLIEIPFMERSTYEKNKLPETTQLETITISEELNNFADFGGDTYAITDNYPEGQIISLGSKTVTNITNLNIPSDYGPEAEYTFIDGFSCSTSISTGTLLNPLYNNKFMYLTQYFDSENDTPFPYLTNVLENTCIVQDNTLPQLGSVHNLRAFKKAEDDIYKPYFYSFFYKAPPILEGKNTIFNKNLANEEQSFVIMGDQLSTYYRFTLYHNPDHSIGYKITMNGTYYDNTDIRTFQGESKDNVLTSEFQHVVIQIYPKLNSPSNSTFIVYVDETPVIIDEIILTSPTTSSIGINNLSTYAMSLTLFAHNNTSVENQTYSYVLGNQTGYNWTPDGTKIAQLEMYYGVYNKKTSYKFYRKDANNNIVQQKLITYRINESSTIEKFKLYTNKLPILKAAMSDQTIPDDSSLFVEQDSISAFTLTPTSRNARIDDTNFNEFDVVCTRDYSFTGVLNTTFETEPVYGTYFRYKIIYKQFDLFISGIGIKLDIIN